MKWHLWKFGAIFLIFFIVDVGIWYEKKLQGQKEQYEQTIDEKDNKISKLQKNKKQYRQTLQDIVVSIYEKENYINVGGMDKKTSDASIEQLINTIKNNTQNFYQYLNSVENFFDIRKDYLHSIPNIFPVPYSSEVRITSGYGYRIYPFTGEIYFHKGIDITGKDTTPIIATANGTVTDVWIYHGVYGKMVKIKHNAGFTTLYAHMDFTQVLEGQEVERGDVIGTMGDTGKSRGVHLHYEIRKDGQLVNPIDYLSSNNLFF